MGLYKLKKHRNNKIIIDKVNIALIKPEVMNIKQDF